MQQIAAPLDDDKRNVRFRGKADIYWIMPPSLTLPSCRGAKGRICIRSSTVVTRQKGATCSDAVEVDSR